MNPESTPERALGGRVFQRAMGCNHGRWVGEKNFGMCLDCIAAFAAEYAREQVDALVEAINKEHGARHGIQPAMGPCPHVTCVAVAKLVAS